MTRKRQTLFGSLLALAAFTPAFAEAPPPEFIQFSPSATKGALYLPDPAEFPNPHVGVVVMHRNSNYMSHISTRELPKRGIVVLGMNPRCDNNEARCAPWENNALDVKQGVEYLRELPGITHVVLLGHSGGGPTMSFYQAVAEEGVGFCQAEEKLIKCDDDLADLPPADGLILMDAHPGNGVNAVRSIDGAVTNDVAVLNDGAEPETDAALDPFAEANGYADDGSAFTEDFRARYFEAQSKRMNTLIEEALGRLAVVEENDLGDAPFVVPLADGARLMDGDVSIHHATEEPRKLLRNDGTVDASAIVESVRVPGMNAEDAKSFDTTMFLTVKSFLSVRAIRSTNSMDGIDWCTSNNSTPCNLQNVSIPLLVTAMGGHYFIRDSEIFFDMAASADKDFVVIEGATHGGTPCEDCQETPDQYSNATKNLFDLMQSWIEERF